MEYRKLGKTELNLSLICLGTMTFGEQNSEAEAHEQLNYATGERGINFIDTAELYPTPPRASTWGLTEKYIGNWLHRRKKRDDLIIATKIVGPADRTKHIRTDEEYSQKSIKEALEGSLKRLQTEYIDLYQIHWPSRHTNFFGKRGYRHREGWENNFYEILTAMDTAIREGKIRHFGLSNETPWGLSSYLNIAEKHNLPSCVSIQNPYSLLNRLFEVGLAEMSIRENIGLLAYSPLAFGRLSGKYELKTDKPEDRINRYPVFSRYNGKRSVKASQAYVQLAQNLGLSPAQMALAFVNQQEFVCSNIIGATNLKQLKENIDSAYLKLSPECVKEINLIHEAIPNPAP